MYKIYSRHRINFPKLNNNNRIPYKNDKKKIALFKAILILVIAFSTVKLVLDAIYPIFDKLCEDKAKSIATIISNDQATLVMRQHSYEELFSIEKDASGNISMIRSNVIPINEIISDVAVKIQNEINARGRDNISIPVGSFTGFKLFAGNGPGINISISSSGNVETDLRSEFSSKGINQTLHRVYLQVDCQVSIVTPFENITKKITNQVLLLENVILGTVPSTYYNLDGLNTRDSMEVID